MRRHWTARRRLRRHWPTTRGARGRWPTTRGARGEWVVRRRTRRQKAVWWTLLAFGVVLTLLAGGARWAFQALEGNIRTDHASAAALRRHADERPGPGDGAGRTVLVIGSDLGTAGDGARADTVMLLHLSGDGRRAEVVGVPRDLVVDIPACEGRDGEPNPATPTRAGLDRSFQYGGAACTIRAVERLTGVRVDNHLVIGFEGFARTVDALGGVEVELERAERDATVGHHQPAGRQLLDGTEALAYVRARGDGEDGDLARLARQQELLRLMYDKLTGDGVVSDPTRLYPVLDALTSAVTADPGLDSLGSLYQLARDLAAVPEDGLRFHVVPTRSDPDHSDRLLLDQPAADRLFAAIREDRPLPAATPTFSAGVPAAAGEADAKAPEKEPEEESEEDAGAEEDADGEAEAPAKGSAEGAAEGSAGATSEPTAAATGTPTGEATAEPTNRPGEPSSSASTGEPPGTPTAGHAAGGATAEAGETTAKPTAEATAEPTGEPTRGESS